MIIVPAWCSARTLSTGSIPRRPCLPHRPCSRTGRRGKPPEMESAALFIVAATRRVKCATILQMLWNQERQAVVRDNAHAAGDMTHAIEVAVSAMRREIRQGKKEEM